MAPASGLQRLAPICSLFVLPSRLALGRMTDAPESLKLATPDDIADTLAFALRFDGRKRKSDASEMMSRIVAERLVRHLEQSGFVVMRRSPCVGAAALLRGHND
jgi:hypothetical protein